MVLVRIDDEFGGDAETFEGLVHLLAAEDGDVYVDIAAEEESGGGDLGDIAERRDVFPGGGRLPGEA